jgi:GNAT superfamily N-acetyltransferase
MNAKEVEGLLRFEFSKVKGLYLPEDDFCLTMQNEEPVEFFSTYSSSKWDVELTDELEKLKDEPYDGLTRIRFGSNSYALNHLGESISLWPNVGQIFYLRVNKDIRGRGFGRGMMEAVERILKQIGKISIYSNEIENPGFWKHMGYLLTGDESDFYYSGIKII